MSEPKDAASLILLSPDRTRVLWARRNPELRFLGGYHSFTGGKLETDDYNCEVRNEPDAEEAALKACAVRETFEEIGVLLVRNGEKLTKGQLRSLHDELISGREQFSSILEHWGLWIDGSDLEDAGIWTTPEFSSIRFRTRFYIATKPEKQEPYRAITELQEIEFTEPSAALDRWRGSEVLLTPPVLFSLSFLDGFPDQEIVVSEAASRSKMYSTEMNGNVHHISLNPRLDCVPLRTKTLPPATHTNCFIAGRRRFVVIDPASHEDSELIKLYGRVDELVTEGGECEAIVISHLHGDHHGGESKLKAHLFLRYGMEVPITGHPLTREALEGLVDFDATTDDGHTYRLQDASGEAFALQVLHTPGHARGHLCFYDPGFGFLLTSDNVLAHGSVLIDPPEGNMTEYLDSLERMRALPGLRFLCGSHGSAVSNAREKITGYIEHRLEREQQVKSALAEGVTSAEAIAEKLYADLQPSLLPLAVRSVTAHLERLRKDPIAGEAPRT